MEELPEDELMMHIHHLLCDDVRKQEAEELGKRCLALDEPLTFDDAAIFFSEEEWKEWKELEGWFQSEAMNEFPSLQAVLAEDNLKNIKNTTEDEPDAKLETNEELSCGDPSTTPKLHLHEESLNNESSSQKHVIETAEKSLENSLTTGNGNIIEERHQPANAVGQDINYNSQRTVNDTDKEEIGQTTSEAGRWSDSSLIYNAPIHNTTEQNYMSTLPDEKNTEIGIHSKEQAKPYENIQKLSDYITENNTDTQQKDQPIILHENETDDEQQITPAEHIEIFSYTLKTCKDVEQKDLPAQPLESSNEAVNHCNTTNDDTGIQNHQPTSPNGSLVEMSSSYNTVSGSLAAQNRQHDGESSQTSPIYFTVNDTAREQNDQSTPPDGNISEKRKICGSGNNTQTKQKGDLTPQYGQCHDTSTSSDTPEGQINSLTPSSEVNHSSRILNGTPGEHKEEFAPQDENKFEIRYYDITNAAGEFVCQQTTPAENCSKKKIDTDREQKEQRKSPDGNSQSAQFSCTSANDTARQQKDQLTKPCDNIQKLLNCTDANNTERQQIDQLPITYENSKKILNYTADDEENGEHKDQSTPSYRNEKKPHYNSVDDTLGKQKLLISFTGNDTPGELKDPSISLIWSSSDNRARYTMVDEDAIIQKHQPTPLTDSWTSKSFSSHPVNSSNNQPTQSNEKGFTLRCCYGAANSTVEEHPTRNITSCSSVVNDASLEQRDTSASSHGKCSEKSNCYCNANHTPAEEKGRPTQQEKRDSHKIFQPSVVNVTTEQQNKLPMYLGQNKSEKRHSENQREQERQPAPILNRSASETNLNFGAVNDGTQEQTNQSTPPGITSEEKPIVTSVMDISRKQPDYPTQTYRKVLEESSHNKYLNDTTWEQEKHPNPSTVKSEQLGSSGISEEDTTREREELRERKDSETVHSSSALQTNCRENEKKPASPAKGSLDYSKAAIGTSRILNDQLSSAGNNTVNRSSYSKEETKCRATPLIVKWWGKGSSSRAVIDIAGEKKGKSRAPPDTVAEKITQYAADIDTSRKQKHEPTSVENRQKKGYQYIAENGIITEPKHRSTPHDDKMSMVSPYCDSHEDNTEVNKDISPTHRSGKDSTKESYYTSANSTTGQQLADSARKSVNQIYCDQDMKDAPEEQSNKSAPPIFKRSDRRSSSRILNNAARERSDLFAWKPSEEASTSKAVNCKTGERSTSSIEKRSSYSSTNDTNIEQSTNMLAKSASCRAARSKSGKEKHQLLHSSKNISEKSSICKTLNNTSKGQNNSSIHSVSMDAGKCAETKIIFRIVNKEEQLTVCPMRHGLENGKNYKSSNNGTVGPKEPPKTRQYVCGKCEESFDWKSMLLKHQRTHRIKEEHTCSECGKTFTRKALLVQHQASHIKKALLTCKECGQRFRMMHHLTKHEAKHSGCGLFICMHCGIRFTQKRQLNQHRVIHAKEKGGSILGDTSQVLTCDQCGATFPQECELAQHLLTHNGKKIFACDNCDKIFPQRCDLIVHQLVHKGKKPFTCDQCGESFEEMFRLMQHKLTHPGKKSFTTWLCSLVQS